MIPLRHAPETLRSQLLPSRSCGVVPPRHHVPCSSFDDHARARLTPIIQGPRLSTRPIHDRGALSRPSIRLSTSTRPITREIRLAATPSCACTFVQKSCSASVLEAIFRRLRSRSSCADRLSATCALRRLDRSSFDARSHRTRPAIRGMFASLSTLTRACRTAIASVHIFRRPRPRSLRDARLLGAHRCACVRRTRF